MAEIIRLDDQTALKIIQNTIPIGRFWLLGESKYIGIDNSTGEVWTEEFDTLDDCLAWLNGAELDDNGKVIRVPEPEDTLRIPLSVHVDGEMKCPCCGSKDFLANEHEHINKFCGNCGQALDWR